MRLSRNLMYLALAAALSPAAFAADANDAAATAKPDAVDTSASSLETVTVTAQRSSENMQDVPITMQAITGQQLAQLHVTTFDDLIKYLPNVTFSSNGPGAGTIFMRGLSAGNLGNQSSSSIAPFPNVAVYLDDQSMQYPQRNVPVYFADIERVEVLEGPQGTLYGGGAQAGAIRYITNKPDLNKFSGEASGSASVTAGGDPNNAQNLVLNLPIIPGTFALRGVVYNDHQGGYIDNVPSTFTRRATDGGGVMAPYIAAGTAQGANNFAVAKKNWNPVDYQGLRLSGLWKINDDWNLLISESYQDMDAEGQSTTYPIGIDGQKLQPLQITSFVPGYDKDKYNNSSWTLNGQIGDFSLVYTGGYTDRHIHQQNDYTAYSRSGGGIYYQCTGTSAGFTDLGKPICYSPVGYWNDQVVSTHQSHELRVNTPEDRRLRAIGGVFWEDLTIHDNMNFNYTTIPSCTPSNLASALAGGYPCVANIQPYPGTAVLDPNPRPDGTAFGEDEQRGYKQIAAFGSVSYDIIPNVLTLTAGTRYYRYTEFQTGSEYGQGVACGDGNDANGVPCVINIANGAPSIATNNSKNMNAENLRGSYHGFKSRANLVYHLDEDMMLYYTFSQGFRPGAFNRTTSGVAKLDGVAQFIKPLSYAPDSLTNNEVGFKGEFLDRRLQFNASAYDMRWNNAQMQFFNPLALGNTTFAVNGPNFKIDGIELQFQAKVAEGLTLIGSGSFNHAKQTTSPCLDNNNKASPGYGKCIVATGTSAAPKPFANPFGEVGSTPPFSPRSQFNLRARYDWEFGSYKAYAQAGVQYTGSMYNQPATYPSGDGVTNVTTVELRYRQDAFTTGDASIGVAKDNWDVALYGTNLGNSHGSLFTSSAEFIKQELPIHPRVIGVKASFKF